ncbi:HD domain-containing protein [Chryseobacterium binzhouense]|uniref:HD domain-containing protein n=1 Tax=Chryseobacterium binzhouense TaxID=2593646 RepID=UPI00117FCE9A|nr:hypothetical protein [Chryseobacterium binzhouense]
MILEETFKNLCFHYYDDQKLIEKLWTEVSKNYAEKSRHYHNLLHIKKLFEEIGHVKQHIKKFEIISFSIFYHDVIYNATSKSNEEKSADYAAKRLTDVDLNTNDIEVICSQILATKSHQKSNDTDTNYLLDADLSILGKNSEIYSQYIQQIRKEYSIYPDFVYKPGRKKVLQHFLDLENIYKTEFFREKYEATARKNMMDELKNLN